MSKPFGFYVECDPVVFDCWLVDKRTNKRIRKASSEEAELWKCLLLTEATAQEYYVALKELQSRELEVLRNSKI